MPKKELKGILGWLLLPVIGLIGTSIDLVYEIISAIGSIEKVEMRISLIIGIILLCLCLNALSLIFHKDKKAPNAVILILWVSLGLGVIDFIVISYNAAYLGGAIITALIWINYFKKSKRVKNTFVN